MDLLVRTFIISYQKQGSELFFFEDEKKPCDMMITVFVMALKLANAPSSKFPSNFEDAVSVDLFGHDDCLMVTFLCRINY